MRLFSGPPCSTQSTFDKPSEFEELKTRRCNQNEALRALSDEDEFLSFEFKRGCDAQQLDARSEMTSASSLFEVSAEQDFRYNGEAPAFVPSQEYCRDYCQTQFVPSDTEPAQPEPSFRRKEKTEICKNWLQGLCRFGAQCAFAHGQSEVQKKTHVAAKYKASLCNSYHKAPFYCQYGARCQFAHLTRDFGDQDRKVKFSYSQLLTENSDQMKIRLGNAAKPDISTFNVAAPSK